MDEAMSYAVGGGYEALGEIEVDILPWAALKEGMTVFDLGCGSGRLAHAISKRITKLEFAGADIIQSLMDYAATKTPKRYRFLLNRTLSIPMLDVFVDFCSAFSVFTRLLNSETYLYLEEMFWALKPGSRVVMSLLEFINPNHWPAFEGECTARRTQTAAHLNSFIERPAVYIWATRIGFEKAVFVSADAAPWDTNALGQSDAVLLKPTSGE